MTAGGWNSSPASGGRGACRVFCVSDLRLFVFSNLPNRNVEEERRHPARTGSRVVASAAVEHGGTADEGARWKGGAAAERSALPRRAQPRSNPARGVGGSGGSDA